MKALVYTGPEAMAFREVPDPARQPMENLIRVDSVGICGSDMHAFLGHDERRPAPLILGHEAAGEVIEGPMKGRRVTVNPLVTCGECRACVAGRTNLCPSRQIISMPPREGAFAELLTMPSSNLVEVPDGVPFDHAALAEPLAVCWHAVALSQKVLQMPLADARCLVIGGGAIGFGSALSLGVFGARDVVLAETNPARRDFIGGHLGAEVTDGAGLEAASFDLVIDAVGFRPTREMACRVVRPGGAICHIGLGDSDNGLDIRRLTLQEITFFGTYTYTADEFRETSAAIFDGRFGALDWIFPMKLEDGASAFADIREGRIMAPKVMLHP